MKNLIVYATKYGYAQRCALELAKKLPGTTDVIDIQNCESPDPSDYENVIIGGSIYMGGIQKKVREFCERNLKTLVSKKTGLFICCGILKNAELNMKNSFPGELLASAAARECFGGEMDTKKMNFLHRAITYLVEKSAGPEGAPKCEALTVNIDKMAEAMFRA